jgi:hypothetical protein
METKDKIWIASKYASKGYGYEDLKYGDDLYHLDGKDEKETILDEIWGYVTEYEDYGSIAFREKYKEFKLY